MDFQQSKTFQNIQSAYHLELAASSIYSIYADRATDDKLIEITNTYITISRNEKEHARIFLKRLNNGIVPPTDQNLVDSSQLELNAANVYRDYAKTAQEEGYSDIAALFNGIANIELNHNLRFAALGDDLARNELLCKPESTLWICMQCGNIMSGICAPAICPVCGFPQGYYRAFSPTEFQP